MTSQIFALIEDQMDLVALEWDYEKTQGLRRIGALVAAGVLGMAAFILIQVALVIGIAELGLKTVYACLVLAGLYGGLALLLIGKFSRRPSRVGMPFQGTREELKKNLKWIQQILS